jgi:GT2 family glycosyltransferase
MNDTERHSLSLLCPTRGRPDRAGEFVDSVFATAIHPDRIGILLYVDDDDPARKDYEQAFSKRAGVKLFIGPAIGVPQAVNRLLKHTDAEILLTANDDQVYIDKGWDIRIDTEAAARPDGVYCLWFNDGWESHNFCTFPIVSRRWVETLGYLQFPFFEHFFADAWIWMLAKSVGRAVYIPDVLVEHRHWKTEKAERDETYERHATKEGDSRHARDRAVIDRFERYFHADVEALQRVIEAA